MEEYGSKEVSGDSQILLIEKNTTKSRASIVVINILSFVFVEIYRCEKNKNK
mgnify:CR=1 FL=1